MKEIYFAATQSANGARVTAVLHADRQSGSNPDIGTKN